jgi:hypothetical protein
VAGSPILLAMTLNKDVMRASVALWNVARKFNEGAVEDEYDWGRYRVHDSCDEVSRIRMCVCEWSDV